MQSLASINQQSVIIKEINLNDNFQHQLLVQGLIIGTNVYVKQNLSGNIIVEFNNLNLAIGKDLATNILVETV